MDLPQLPEPAIPGKLRSICDLFSSLCKVTALTVPKRPLFAADMKSSAAFLLCSAAEADSPAVSRVIRDARLDAMNSTHRVVGCALAVKFGMDQRTRLEFPNYPATVRDIGYDSRGRIATCNILGDIKYVKKYTLHIFNSRKLDSN